MPEKKPVPPPAPRNRHERRKLATKQRKARPWTRPKPKPELPGEWFTYSPSPGCKPVFEVIRDGMGEMDKPAHTITGSPGHVPGDVVVVPGEDGKPELRQIVPGVPDAQVIGRVDRSETTSRPVEYLADQHALGSDAAKRRLRALMRAASTGGLVVLGGDPRDR